MFGNPFVALLAQDQESNITKIGTGRGTPLRLMVSMQAPLQAPDIGRETMLTDIWETPEVLRGLLHLAGSENQSAAVAAFLPQERSVDI